jgi:hypothetical protein
VLRQYHAVLGELIPAVLSNDPVPVDRHELEAVRLALAAQQRFSAMAEAWQKRGTRVRASPREPVKRRPARRH